jgi:hypothetical protein
MNVQITQENNLIEIWSNGKFICKGGTAQHAALVRSLLRKAKRENGLVMTYGELTEIDFVR